MGYDEFLDELTMEDLQEQHRELADAVGLQSLITLSKNYGGTQIYIPMQLELVKDLRYKKISEEYDGDNLQQLALKYNVSERTVYRVVKDKIAEKKAAPMEGQMSLFG